MADNFEDGMMLSPRDEAVRGRLTRMIAELGHAPPTAQLAQACALPEAELEAALHRLHDRHALLLHPGSSLPWVVHPFALSPG
jgi:hypothetical protein